MAERYGLLTATLADAPEQGRLQELAALVNERINPPEQVTAEDILVRGMYVVSDEVNSFGGRFPASEFQSLKEKLINTPVLVGHRKDSLPIGRTFHAELVERNGRPWVKSLFYWLKSADGAQMLADNIDGGIYQECSIGFMYRLPECSICGNDIRLCEHQVFSNYPNNGAEQSCHFLYREIEKVLETSLVYRGANPDTGMSRELAEGGLGEVAYAVTKAESHGAGDNERLLVIPCYDAITVHITKNNEELLLSRVDGNALSKHLEKQILTVLPKSCGSCYAQLVGYRGKERCSLVDLERYLSEKTSPVTRIELKMLPDMHGNVPDCKSELSHEQDRIAIRAIPYRIVAKGELDTACQAIRTKEGVRIWQLATYDPTQSGVRYVPEKHKQPSYAKADSVFTDAVTQKQYRINQFDERLWNAGRGFLADIVVSGNSESKQKSMGSQGTSTRVRPILLHGRRRFLAMKPSEQSRKQVVI